MMYAVYGDNDELMMIGTANSVYEFVCELNHDGVYPSVVEYKREKITANIYTEILGGTL